MRLTKFGHAAVRLEKDGQTLVVDPGALTEPEALDGADAVLVTHEHYDHFVEENLRAAAEANPGLRIWTNPDVAKQLDGLGAGRVNAVTHGDTFTAAGFDVEVHGEWHAPIHPELPNSRNIGFVLDDGKLFYPGDAFTLPERKIDTLLLLSHAPWANSTQIFDYARAVGASRAFNTHDALLSDAGRAIVGGFFDTLVPGLAYAKLAIGEPVEI
ncbi:MBL fold metallo-hydrolase (plasmid) [Streptomyces sp. NBC_01450]|uniref:MBL fold metallo-hydrolase n=1 Tax=Streptomyces sp. NBC_01450 TaxID=2903871 RepID=UPI002E378910|nr:MBL fold metallo-hydrolase [Streptomyces sp. NBC_01450]